MNEIRLTGGISYNINTGDLNPRFGYMVSLPCCEEIVSLSMMDQDTIEKYIEQHASALAKENAYLGCWFDGHKYVLDVSEHYETKRDAVYFAIVRKQKAIWDCEKKDDFRIKIKNDEKLVPVVRTVS